MEGVEMKFTQTKLSGAYIIDLDRKEDSRGFFSRTWSADILKTMDLNTALVQGNMSVSRYKGTVRGMHYQAAPHRETKLIRVTHGAIYDVIIDLRPDSPTYKQWIGVELTRENYRSLYVPEGFAHGFITLEDDTEVAYWVTAAYEPTAERGVRWNDPQFGIQWPVEMKYISEKDAAIKDFV